MLKDDSIIENLKIGGSVTPPTVISGPIGPNVFDQLSSRDSSVGHVKFTTGFSICQNITAVDVLRSKEPLARRIGEVVKRAITGEVDIFQHSSSNFGAIGSPYFPTAHSVIAAEENSSTYCVDVFGSLPDTRIHIFNHSRTLWCAVAHPQFMTMDSIVSAEICESVIFHHVSRITCLRSNVEAPNFSSCRAGSTRYPHRDSTRVCCEKEHQRARWFKCVRRATDSAGINIMNQRCAVGSSVGFPEFLSVGAVIGTEVCDVP